jgi:hypothetical protein
MRTHEANSGHQFVGLGSIRVAIVILLATFAIVAAVQWAALYINNLRLAAQPTSAAPEISLRASETSEFSLREYLHLALPIAVLVMEIYVIYRMVEESRERRQTISEFRELAAHSRRAEYMLDIASAIRETKAEARFTSVTMEVSSRSQAQKTIVEAAKGRRERGVYSHRGLVALSPRALPGALELAMLTPHIKVKFHEMIAISRLRFFVRDREESILGVAEGQPDLATAQETTQSTRVRSRMLANALEKQFDLLWAGGKELKTYLDELIHASHPATKAEIRSWFSAIQCETTHLDNTLSQNSSLYGSLPEEVSLDADTLATSAPEGNDSSRSRA